MSDATPGADYSSAEEAPPTAPVRSEPEAVLPPPRANVLIKEMLRGSAFTTFLAIVLALLVGGVLIAFTNADVQAASGYFFARPGDMIAAAWNSVYNGYEALFRGAIFNARGADFAAQIRPLTNTLGFAAPLIAAGLGVALAFRVGLFNIGARGQMLIGVGVAGLLTFSLDLPMWLHIPVTLIAGIAGGALWGAVAGLIKARTGAHEVILTIMLNYVAYYLLLWMIRTPGLLQKPGTNQALGFATPPSAQFPELLGKQFPLLDLGFVLVIIATLFVWWLIERSALGLRMRAVGENPHAAKAAGIAVQRIYVYAMLFAGALAGL
ncbi:MAG: ABC transporter permease, partial [Microbacterium sp.]|uniref:ABC transporter permease n=1 Tax=Microbacterium sp. TaxID=51671 RepID=UPI003BAF4F46